MDLIKKFMKIGGFKTREELEAYGEDNFFRDFPQAKQYAKGGTIEAYPQIATFDNAFSYGVKPGPQYLAHGGSAFPQAQTEAQFFIPIYTDVYNPYNKAMGGPNKKKKQQKAEDAGANRIYDKMTHGYTTDAYDEFTGIGHERASDLSGRFNPNSEINTWSHGNQIYDPGAYANWINKKLGRQAVMPLQKPFEGPYDITGRTPNWKNLPDQMDISEPYVDSGIDYSTLTPSNPKNYLYVEPELKMGGSNEEMYPNAKVMPHWGPTNVWFQDGGQDMPQQNEELDRAGVLNRTGSFVTSLKAAAAKSNARTAMNSAMGMAKYGKEISKYAPGGYTVSGNITPYVTEQMSPTSSRFATDTPTYSQQLQANNLAYLNSIGYNPYAGQMMQQGYGHNQMAMGNMSNFLPSIYDWNNMNQFMFQTKGSPKYKWRTDVPGQGRQRGVSNMHFLNAIFPELYGNTEAQMKALNDPKYADRRKQWGINRITNTPKGVFGKRNQLDIYFGDNNSSTPSTFPNWGTGTSKQQSANQGMSPYGPYASGYAFGPDGSQSSAQGVPPSQAPGSTSNAAASSSVNPDADYIKNSKYPDLDQPFTGTNMTQRERLLQQLSSSDPKEVEYAKYRIGAMNDWDAMQGSTTTTSQAPSNANSMDAATAQKKASMMSPNVNQAFIDAQQGIPYRAAVGPMAEAPGEDFSYLNDMPTKSPEYMTGAPYRTQVGPVEVPSQKFGGSYKQGDVVYMSDDEIAEFIRNGGQIEEME